MKICLLSFVLFQVVQVEAVQAKVTNYQLLCRTNGDGEYREYQGIAFCKYGNTEVRAETLANFIWFKKKDQSLQNYEGKKSECKQITLSAVENDGTPANLTVCVYPKETIQVGDVAESYHPMIDVKTMENTSDSSENESFNKVLRQAFP